MLGGTWMPDFYMRPTLQITRKPSKECASKSVAWLRIRSAWRSRLYVPDDAVEDKAGAAHNRPGNDYLRAVGGNSVECESVCDVCTCDFLWFPNCVLIYITLVILCARFQKDLHTMNAIESCVWVFIYNFCDGCYLRVMHIIRDGCTFSSVRWLFIEE